MWHDGISVVLSEMPGISGKKLADLDGRPNPELRDLRAGLCPDTGQSLEGSEVVDRSCDQNNNKQEVLGRQCHFDRYLA